MMDAVREGRLGSLFYSGLVGFGRDWSGLLGIRHGLTFAVALVRRDKSSRQSGGQGEPRTCCGLGGYPPPPSRTLHHPPGPSTTLQDPPPPSRTLHHPPGPTVRLPAR